MKKATAVLGVLLTCSLGACSIGGSPDPSVAKSVAESIAYSKDTRSGLCFGSYSSSTHSGYKVLSITEVPCEKVEHLLVK